MDRIDEGAFVVRLERLHLDAESRRRGTSLGLVVGEGGRSVDVRLALAEQVQVRTMEQQEDRRGHDGERYCDHSAADSR